MALTTAQRTTLKADMQSGANAAALEAYLTATDWPSVEAWYNAPSSPDFWVYRTILTKAEVTQGISQDGTTFTFSGNGFITRTPGEIEAWKDLWSLGSVNPSRAPTRVAFGDVFSGTGNAALNRTHLLALARRKATRVEKLFATGTGSTAAPATMGVEGQLTYQDVQQAMLSG
jgi:hypothetical protein